MHIIILILVAQIDSLNDSTLERYKIRHFSPHGAEDGGFIVYKRKNALKTAEMSGKRTKIGHFPYIKQNSIAEIVSTMESFLCMNSLVNTMKPQKRKWCIYSLKTREFLRESSLI